MTTVWWPDHLLTLDEWEDLPEDASRHYELVEGVLLVVPRPAPLHQRAMVRLAFELDRQLPDALTALADVEVLVDAGYPATVRAPDVVIVHSECAQQNPSRLVAADVLVAVEIVSPGTGRTDRITKPAEYADAAIPHYWLVELDASPVLTAYTLAGGYYERVVAGTGLITIPAPAPVALDLDALIARR